MSFLRLTRQPALCSIARSNPTIAITSRRAAHQDYGSGEGNPAGENPQSQGKNPSEKVEHPGPEPPTAGKKPGEKQPGSQQQQQQQQEPPSQGSSSNKSTQGARPKILSDSPPQQPGKMPGEVEIHNKEMDQRAEKANEKVRAEDLERDKVPKGFWAGHGGKDRQP
ncbi:hypothetical protein KC316_g660 [Hortaea werneckii]|nr:hypothetical protein KC324_g208 [Hortaea werneckii]KAI7595231.1 hypothetical protein KC316_g660 [Hortaea werneckii]